MDLRLLDALTTLVEGAHVVDILEDSCRVWQIEDVDLQEYMGRCAEVIAEHGWMVQGVGGMGATPGFCYTIGLTEHNHPELLMRGLDIRLMHTLLNDLARPVLEQGVRYQPGDRVPNIVRDYDVLIHGPIEPRAAEMIQALNLYGGIDALQVLWPAADGTFPTVEDGSFTQPVAALL